MTRETSTSPAESRFSKLPLWRLGAFGTAALAAVVLVSGGQGDETQALPEGTGLYAEAPQNRSIDDRVELKDDPREYSPEAMLEYLEDYDYDDDPTIIQYLPAMPSPKPEWEVDLQGTTIHWWGFDGGGNIESFVHALRSNKSCGSQGCTSQYAITKNGDIYRMMNSALDYAYHAGRPANLTTAAIEIEGTRENFDPNSEKFNPVAFIAAVELTAELTDDYNLTIESFIKCGDDNLNRMDGVVRGINGHHDYEICEEQGKTDPGDWYVDQIRKRVTELLDR